MEIHKSSHSRDLPRLKELKVAIILTLRWFEVCNFPQTSDDLSVLALRTWHTFYTLRNMKKNIKNSIQSAISLMKI